MRRLHLFCCGAVLASALAGCYESPDVVLHEVGKYKGKRDSAAILHPTDEQRAILSARFRAVQTDR